MLNVPEEIRIINLCPQEYKRTKKIPQSELQVGVEELY